MSNVSAHIVCGCITDDKMSKSVNEGRLSMHSDVAYRSSGFDDDEPPEGTKGMVLPFQPLSISFSKIYYYVDMPEVSTTSIDMEISLKFVESLHVYDFVLQDKFRTFPVL